MPLKGKVIQSTGSWYLVDIRSEPDQKTDIIECRLPGRFRLKDYELTNPVAVGDNVKITINEDGTGSIEEIEERDNYVIRQATHGRRGEQILVANVDRAFVIQSIRKPKLKHGFVDRFLVMCEAYEVEPYIVINKMDLASENDKKFVSDLISLYRSLNYKILTTSIEIEESLEELKNALKGLTSVFIGPSGVGKTSLLNKIDPGINRPVAEISNYSQKGKHTTTHARLLPLEIGGYLVDTPGIREFGLVNIEPWELSLYYPEMLKPREECRFNNCTHSHEPGCGVREAVKDDKIDEKRYKTYLQILDSLKN